MRQPKVFREFNHGPIVIQWGRHVYGDPPPSRIELTEEELKATYEVISSYITREGL